MRKVLSKIYKFGVYISFFIIFTAILENIITGGEINTYSTINIVSILKGVFHFNSNDTFYFAIMILMMTPITAIIYACASFFSAKNYKMFIASFLLIAAVAFATVFSFG